MKFWKKRKTEPPPDPRVAGVVPCAGSSTRMGSSKALLDAGGRSFLAATVGSLVAGGCDPVVVVLAAGQTDEERRARDAGALPLLNPEPGEGPITSLRIAIQALGDSVEGVALLPVDHPCVLPETVTVLNQALLEGDAPLVLPSFEGKRGHPAFLRRTLFPELLDPSLEGGARSVVHAHLTEALVIDVEDAGVVLDIDTPEAYARAFPAGRSL